MKLLEVTWPTPAENLACDEALLDWGEETGGEVLRFWEPAQYFVVVGYANRAAVEANLDACAELGVGIHRRCSGGGTVLQGPGCLNYSVVLQIPEQGELAGIGGTNRFVMERNRQALAGLLGREISVCGHTDLAVGGRKFSGNAQRRRRRALLFHGTFLCGLDLALVGRCLNFPSQAPGYREGRSHAEFLLNLEVSPAQVKAALRRAWQAEELLHEGPRAEVQRLAREKYAARGWNLKL